MNDDNNATKKETPEEMRKRLEDLEKRIEDKDRELLSGNKLAGFQDDFSHSLHGEGEARHEEDD